MAGRQYVFMQMHMPSTVTPPKCIRCVCAATCQGLGYWPNWYLLQRWLQKIASVH